MFQESPQGGRMEGSLGKGGWFGAGRAGRGQVMDDEVYTKAAAAEQQSGGTESQNPDSPLLS